MKHVTSSTERVLINVSISNLLLLFVLLLWLWLLLLVLYSLPLMVFARQVDAFGLIKSVHATADANISVGQQFSFYRVQAQVKM